MVSRHQRLLRILLPPQILLVKGHKALICESNLNCKRVLVHPDSLISFSGSRLYRDGSVFFGNIRRGINDGLFQVFVRAGRPYARQVRTKRATLISHLVTTSATLGVVQPPPGICVPFRLWAGWSCLP